MGEFMNSPMTVRRFLALTVIAGVVVALLPYIIFPHPRQKPFDQAEWTRLSSDKASKSERGAMADDLIRNHLKKGLLRETVMSILGTPDSQAREGCPRYYIGWYKSMMDPESMVVCFGKDGKLTETYIWQH